MKAANELLRKTEKTFITSYSGGELCPVYAADGTTVNRNHNNTLIICAI